MSKKTLKSKQTQTTKDLKSRLLSSGNCLSIFSGSLSRSLMKKARQLDEARTKSRFQEAFRLSQETPLSLEQAQEAFSSTDLTYDQVLEAYQFSAKQGVSLSTALVAIGYEYAPKDSEV